nr:hypothetical protein [Lujinxingiaceae bacterium]
RRIIARGYDVDGKEIAKKEISITVTGFDGTIPGGQTEPGSPGAGNVNAALAEKMAIEGGKCLSPPEAARCTNGTGGFSTGNCWRFVKRALERAGINYNKLQNAGPCSSFEFQIAARGFRCNADANPTILAQIGLKKINVPTTQAPRGAIISWEKNCLGYNARYGHIEISQGNGTACSDYCGRIRGDAPSCASVYVAID